MTSNIQMTTDLTKLVLLPRRIFQLGCIQKTICILIQLFLPKKAESADTAIRKAATQLIGKEIRLSSMARWALLKDMAFQRVCGAPRRRHDPPGWGKGKE